MRSSVLLSAFLFPNAFAVPAKLKDLRNPKGAGGVDDDDDDAIVNKLLEYAAPLAEKLTINAVAGYCAGSAVKYVGQVVAIGAGGVFIVLQTLAYFDLIEIKWSNIKQTGIEVLDTDGDGKFTETDVKIYLQRLLNLLTYGLPAGAGFSLGFYYGFSYA